MIKKVSQTRYTTDVAGLFGKCPIAKKQTDGTLDTFQVLQLFWCSAMMVSAGQHYSIPIKLQTNNDHQEKLIHSSTKPPTPGAADPSSSGWGGLTEVVKQISGGGSNICRSPGKNTVYGRTESNCIHFFLKNFRIFQKIQKFPRNF